jgi:hypothetical protein
MGTVISTYVKHYATEGTNKRRKDNERVIKYCI